MANFLELYSSAVSVFKKNNVNKSICGTCEILADVESTQTNYRP
jgi:hypothetical protein